MPPWHRVWVTPSARQWKLCIFNAVSLMMNGEREKEVKDDEGRAPRETETERNQI